MRCSYSVFTFFGGGRGGRGRRTPLLPQRCWFGASWVTIPPSLCPPCLAGVHSSSFTSRFGLRSADVPREEEDPEPNDNDIVLLGAQGWKGGGADVLKVGDGYMGVPLVTHPSIYSIMCPCTL